MIKLTVFLKDGRELTGTYTYEQAFSRLAWAQEQPNYDCCELTEAV